MNDAEFTTKWEMVNGQQVCVGVTVHAPHGITAEGMRRLLTVHAINTQRPPLTPERRRITPATPSPKALAERGALQPVADVYILAVTEGRWATIAVAEALGISRTAAAKRVQRARNAGLIPPTVQGKGGW